MNIPGWLQHSLNENDYKKVETAVREAEKKTSGEIVPVILQRSSTVGHVPFLLFTVLTSLYFGFDWPEWRGETLGSEWWWYLVETVTAFLLIRFLSARNGVQRWLTSKEDLEKQVYSRAELEFFESNIKSTEGSTGILLFLSMMEHKAVVLADRSIAEKLPPETWDRVVQTMVLGAKNKELGEGLKNAITICGDLLSKHFPIATDDENELPNHLIIKDF